MDALYTSLQMNEITEQFEPQEMEEQKVLVILTAIISILFFLPAVSYKDSAYAKTISNQFLTIFLTNLVNVFLVGNIPFIGGIASFVVSAALLVIIVTKIIDAATGKVRTLPFGLVIDAFK